MELSHKTDFVKVFMKNENFRRILIRFANGIVNSQDFGSVSQYSKRDNSDNPHGHLCVKQLSKATILEHALADPDGVFVSHNPLVKFQTTFLNVDVYSVYIIYLFLNEHAPPPHFSSTTGTRFREKYKASTTTRQGNSKYLPFSLLFNS